MHCSLTVLFRFSAVSKERESYDEPALLYRSPSSFALSQSFFDRYNRLQEIYEFIDALAADNPRFVSTFNIGKSYEGRDLKVIKIGTTGFFRKNKPAIYLDGGIHAREWVAITTVLYIAQHLVTDYDSDPTVRKLVSKISTMLFFICHFKRHSQHQPSFFSWSRCIHDRLITMIGFYCRSPIRMDTNSRTLT